MAEIADRFRKRCADAPEFMVGTLVDSIPYPLIIRDLEYQVVLANRAAGEFYAEDLLECKCYEASELEGCLCENCPAEEAFRAETPVQREVRHPETGDYLLIDVYPMFEPDGEACAIIETVRDVTERREREDRIRTLLSEVTAKNQKLTEWRRSFQYQLKVAREIQRRLVPSAPLCISGICFDFLYRPSGEVGGDLFDVIPLEGDSVGMLVSDASGHGVAAGLIAVMIRMICNSSAVDRSRPVTVLEAVNQELLGVIPRGQFATAFYAVCDREAERLRFAAAGHPAPLLLQGEETRWLEEGGLPLGSLEEAAIEEHTVPFGPEHKLLLYTDGLLDATNEAGERFGRGRLRELAEEHRAISGPDFLRAVISGMESFTGGASAPDDVTIVLAESVRGDSAPDGWGSEGRD